MLSHDVHDSEDRGIDEIEEDSQKSSPPSTKIEVDEGCSLMP